MQAAYKVLVGVLSFCDTVNTVNPRFQHVGTEDVFQHAVISLWTAERSIGHLFNIMFDIWSNGHKLELLLLRLTVRLTSLYEGGSRLHEKCGGGRDVIQPGITNRFNFFGWDNIVLKKSKHASKLNDGIIQTDWLNNWLHAFQNDCCSYESMDWTLNRDRVWYRLNTPPN